MNSRTPHNPYLTMQFHWDQMLTILLCGKVHMEDPASTHSAHSTPQAYWLYMRHHAACYISYSPFQNQKVESNGFRMEETTNSMNVSFCESQIPMRQTTRHFFSWHFLLAGFEMDLAFICTTLMSMSNAVFNTLPPLFVCLIKNSVAALHIHPKSVQKPWHYDLPTMLFVSYLGRAHN